MGMGFSIGLMELNIMDFGKKIKLVEKVNSSMQMVMYMKVNGKMIKLPDSESTYIQNHKLNTKVIGKMTRCMVQGLKFMQMGTNMKECSSKAKDVERELIIFQMVRFTRDNGTMEKLKDLESVNGLMEKLIKVIGWIIRKMGWGFLNGLMDVNIEDTIETIKNMVKVLMYGLMVENILDNGKMINVMEKDNM